MLKKALFPIRAGKHQLQHTILENLLQKPERQLSFCFAKNKYQEKIWPKEVEFRLCRDKLSWEKEPIQQKGIFPCSSTDLC